MSVKTILSIFRIPQWIKNLFIFAPLIFGHELMNPASLSKAVGAVLFFCFASSFVYILNDWLDRKADAHHPIKKTRPFACGQAGAGAMLGGLVFCALAALVLARAQDFGTGFYGIVFVYFINGVAYSFWLKNVPLVELCFVAFGYILRVLAGSLVLGLPPSVWMILSTGFVSFLVIALKRHSELVNAQAQSKRQVLAIYNEKFLHILTFAAAGLTLVSYFLFTIFNPNMGAGQMPVWLLTNSFVIFGVARFVFLGLRRGKCEDPTLVVMRDPYLVATLVLWGGMVTFILYFM